MEGDNAGKMDPVLYLPFFDFECLNDSLQKDFENFDYDDFTESEFNYYHMLVE